MSDVPAMVCLFTVTGEGPDATTRQVTWIMPADGDPAALEETFTHLFGRRLSETYSTLGQLDEAEARIEGLRVTIPIGGPDV